MQKSINTLQEWLDHYLNFEKHPQKNIFWLETMRFFCNRFNHPELASKSIHVAGSKGKGSVSSFISSILDEAGYKTGLYTSPHIIDFTERIGSARGPFSDEVYDKSVKELIKGVENIKDEELPSQRAITWFELVTLFAFLCCKNANTDWSVYEVGLGGRLDSTNVIQPEICCITPIELEHTEYLGDTLEKIATEKAGIIKDKTPVVISKQPPEVKQVFMEIAKQHNSPITFIEDVITCCKYSYLHNSTKTTMKIKIDSPVFKRAIETELELLGEVQAWNAAQAAITIKKLYPDIDEAIIERGLSKTKIAGRFEVIHNIKNFENIHSLILDGAHTVNSIKYTLNTLDALTEKNEKVHLLFACAADKDVEDIAKLFTNKFSHITLTKPGNVKASNIERAEKAFNNAGIKYTAGDDFNKMIADAIENANKEKATLLATGSFYLIAEIKKILER